MPYNAIVAAAPATNLVFGAPKVEQGETLRTLREKLSISLAQRTDLNTILLNSWINDAYVDVATTFEFNETEFMLSIDLIAGQPFYSLPSNIDYTTNALLQLPDTTSYREGQRLDKIDLAMYRRLPDLTATGLQAQLDPTRYFIYGNVLVLYPAPWIARTLVLDGNVVPMALESETDSPILSREWHRAILLKAREMVLTDNNSPQEALLAANNFARYVQSRTSRKAMEKVNRLATVSLPGRSCGYDLGQNSGNPFVDMGDRGYYGV